MTLHLAAANEATTDLDSQYEQRRAIFNVLKYQLCRYRSTTSWARERYIAVDR